MIKKLSNNRLNCVVKQKPILQTLTNSDRKVQKIILDRADKKLVSAICILIFNILKGKLIIDNDDKIKLQKYKKQLRKLVSKSQLEDKKKILQSGGFLNTLLPLLLTGISAITNILQQ